MEHTIILILAFLCIVTYIGHCFLNVPILLTRIVSTVGITVLVLQGYATFYFGLLILCSWLVDVYLSAYVTKLWFTWLITPIRTIWESDMVERPFLHEQIKQYEDFLAETKLLKKKRMEESRNLECEIWKLEREIEFLKQIKNNKVIKD